MTANELIDLAFSQWLREYALPNWQGLTANERDVLLEYHGTKFMRNLRSTLADAGVKLATVQATPVERPPFTVDDEEVAPCQATSS